MSESPAGAPALRKPEWLKIKVRGGENLNTVKNLLSGYALHTVCKEANCPNRMECYANRTATFMILGAVCTRGCAFCNVKRGSPSPVDSGEAGRIAEVSAQLGLRYAVITSVTRDDLPDGGAAHFAHVIRTLKTALPEILVEALVPDFQGSRDALQTVLEALPDVLNHNVETVPRLYPAVRPQAVYERSLELLRRVKQAAAGGMGVKTKSGIMVGLGESPDEIREALRNLREADCDYLTIGQYLAPSAKHYPVAEYITPACFEEYKSWALSAGFQGVASGPFVRSSYKAAAMAGR
ncbi:MAG: lipoyl synthase [Spirochaetales bacterium]|jgi:lipoic acid synthetase|nr:lipoyl synthase [Spirochaetales bacterium]